MSEPSEAAMRKACELLGDDTIIVEAGSVARYCTKTRTILARVLQEHSDVAKEMRACLEADRLIHLCNHLILPDEPKTFTVKMLMTREEQLRAIGRALDEGKTIKIVEASDE